MVASPSKSPLVEMADRLRALADQAAEVARSAQEVEREKERLQQEVQRLRESQQPTAVPAPVAAPSSPPAQAAADPALHDAFSRLSKENMELANRLAELEEMNSAMMSMYVSSYQLHASLDPDRVINIVKEIVINFVGGEEFAILLREEDSEDFDVVAGEGHERHYPERRVAAQGVLGAVVASQEPFVHVEEGPPRGGVLAAVPLGLGNRVVGAVVIFKLLQQKPRLNQSDVELLHLLSAHAATALMSARSHSKVDRKLKTLEGLMQLLRAEA
ncbi:MAG: GAF domain-containing protein [Myxococcota bacterium]